MTGRTLPPFSEGRLDDDTPALLQRQPLTGRERRWVVAAGMTPIVLAGLVLVPVALLGPASVLDVVVAAGVYGGLMGLAAAFVAVDRLQARQCPRCGRRRGSSDERCQDCGYDLAEQPRFACPQRHAVYVEPGLCRCGRRLSRIAPPRGVGHEVVTMLKVGAWLLTFLVGVGVILRLLE